MVSSVSLQIKVDDSVDCAVINKQYWNLIDWFYGRTTNICVTTITDSADKKNQYGLYQDIFLHRISESKRNIIRILL